MTIYVTIGAIILFWVIVALYATWSARGVGGRNSHV